MNGVILLIIAAAVLAAAYFFYGRFPARSRGIDPARKIPAREFEDGAEYVPGFLHRDSRRSRADRVE
jgi:carbon starvation protein